MNTVGRAALSSLILGCLAWSGAAEVPPDDPRAVAGDSATRPSTTPARAELARLRHLCAPLWGDLSPDCAAELERTYMDRNVVLNRHSDLEQSPGAYRFFWRPYLTADRIVWRDVFRDPLAVRQAVEAAAAKPQCHAKVGEAPHHLREACAADAFARLSVLNHACGRALHFDGQQRHPGWAEEWERERRRVDKRAQNSEDHMLRMAALDESELHFAWRLRKCRAVPPAVMERIVPVRVPPIHYHYHKYSQWWHLMVIAARLGSPWANVRAGGTGLRGLEVNATAKADLALAYVRRAMVAASSLMDRSSHLAYLLAAREHDVRKETPRLDWSDLRRHFADAEIDRARPAVRRLLRHGWQAMEEPHYEDATWPWAVAPPTVATRTIGRRRDPDGIVRWVYDNGDEAWYDSEGASFYRSADTGKISSVTHSLLQVRKMPKLRRWEDEEGLTRRLDYFGKEHWIDADGAEHWVDADGTEWILLPPEPPPQIPRHQ